MGYSTDVQGRICCDGCGRTGGGTRKRTCPHKVLTAATHGGSRQRIAYCYPPALCSDCFAKAGATKGVHQGHAAGAALTQAGYDAEQAKLDAGDLLVTTGWGSWADWVPEGFTGVDFRGLGGATARVLLPAADYCESAFTLAEYRELTDVRDLVAA